LRPGKYRSDHHRFTGETPEKPPGALKNPFLIRRYAFFVEKGDSTDSSALLKGQIEAFPCFVGPGMAGFYREFDREFTGKPTGK
jgi:hypothetical protein